MRRIRASGGGTGELSYYPPLNNLLNAVGSSLRPKVYCVSQLAQQGAGHPDFGLYAARQVSKGLPKQGQTPEGGVVEVKSASDDAWLTANSAQVSRYWERYRLVLVTNTRDFVLLGEDAQGNPARLETFRLADSAAGFEAKLQHPRAFANNVGPALAEYLGRALSHRATLAEPRDPGPAAGLLRPRRPGASGGVRRRTVTERCAIGTGGGAGSPLRGRARRGLLPLDAGADSLLRRLFGLGAVGTAITPSGPAVQLARNALAPARPHPRSPVQAGCQPGAVAVAGLSGGAGLDSGGLGAGRPRGLFRPVQRGRGGALLLRAVPGGLRPSPAQAARRLVYPGRGGALHGGPRRPRPEGRPGHRRRVGLRERLCPRPLLRHRGLPGRDAQAHCRQPTGQGPGRPHRCAG